MMLTFSDLAVAFSVCLRPAGWLVHCILQVLQPLDVVNLFCFSLVMTLMGFFVQLSV